MLPKTFFLVAFLLVPAFSQGPQAEEFCPLFFSTQNFPIGEKLDFLLQGDFNEDGILDLATGGSWGFAILLGSSQDGIPNLFQPPVYYWLDGFPTNITKADFNSDGILDLATSNYQSDVSILLGNGQNGVGDGTFGPRRRFLAHERPPLIGDTWPTSLTPGDFNGDGITDLAVAHMQTNDVSILIGIGDGTFQFPVYYQAHRQPYSIIAGDFNSDGITDLAVATAASDDVTILIGKGTGGVGDGTFNPPVYYPANDCPGFITSGDFNADGITDLAVPNWFSNHISILIGGGAPGAGDGTFLTPVPYQAHNQPWSIATGDLNKDGITDLAVANFQSDDISILFGNGSDRRGDGTFQEPLQFLAGDSPWAVTVGDFDGDGRNDVAVANYYSMDVLILNLFPREPQFIRVDDNAANDPGPGNPDSSDPLEDGTQAHPFDSIQEAIDVAKDGDTVIVLDGTYTGDGNRDIDFKGKAITVRSENGPENCIIDCQHHRGFYFSSGEEFNSVLDGFTITNGYTNNGGGIRCDSSSPTIMNCIFLNNSASYHGGGMYNWSSSPTLINCTFSENSANRGGGMMNTDVWNGVGSNPTLINCTFSRNSGLGGGMTNDIGSPTLINCTFTNNSGRLAAGMQNHTCSPTLTNCTFSGNWAGEQGGGMGNWASSPMMVNCTFSDNTAGDYGGGIYTALDSSPKLINCILWGNTAPSGAEIALRDMIPDPHPSTITISYSNVKGGPAGVYLHPNCTLNWGEGNINADPLFVDPCNGDYRLLLGSPCIDAGNKTTIPADTTDLDGDGDTTESIPWDLDGNPRIVGNEVDMGAYEAVLPPIEVAMKFTPQALNCDSKGKWVKAHFVLPAEFTIGDVDTNSPAKVEPPGIESEYMNVFVDEDDLIEVEAAFDRAAFCDAITGCGAVEVTVVGLLTNGQYFYGTDTIKIIKSSFECLAILSSHWLEANCGKPDWCNRFDINRDSVVNLKDFALMASHWLEDYSD